MNTFLSLKKRVVIMTVLIAFVVVFGAPQLTYAQSWSDNPSSQIFKSALDEMKRIVEDIQRAVVTVVLMQSISRQIDQIIGSSGGAIVGTQGWIDYLSKADDTAATKARNILAASTRGVATNYLRGEGDSIAGRIADFIDAGLNGDKIINSTILPNDYLRNGSGVTINKITGKSELNNIAALTAVLDARNNIMMAQISADTFEKLRQEETEARKLKQTGAGFDSAQPLQTAEVVNNLSQATMSAALNGVKSPIVKRIVMVVFTRFVSKLSAKAEKRVTEIRRSVGKVLNKVGGRQQYKIDF